MKGKRKQIVNIPNEYMDSIRISNPIFPLLFQFENGLRIIINDFLATCYGPNWWETSLRIKKSDIYDYAENAKNKRSYMPWIGASSAIQTYPIHSITIGQLEEIVKVYKSDCVPELFPTIEFFCGHMELIKRVRNLFAHMHPCVTKNDVEAAKREIITLSEHINNKLKNKP
jgi:hypothetical protein